MTRVFGHFRWIATLGLLYLLGACASSPPRDGQAHSDGIEIAGIIIRNGLTYSVYDVMVVAPVSGAFAGCGNILPRTGCRTSFPARDYRKNPIVVNWVERGEPKNTDEIVAEVPEYAEPGDAFWLEVIIYAPGLAGAKLVRP